MKSGQTETKLDHPAVSREEAGFGLKGPDYSRVGSNSIDAIIGNMSKNGKNAKIETIMAWIVQQNSIAEIEWAKIIDFAKSLDSDSETQILLELSLKDISSDRGLALFKSTLNRVGSGERRMSAIKHAVFSVDPSKFPNLLLSLDSGGYVEDSRQAVMFLGKSDLVRGEQGKHYLEQVMATPALRKNPSVAAMLAGQYGASQGRSQPSLTPSVPLDLASYPQVVKDAYISSFVENAFTNGGFLENLKSSDVLRSAIPENLIIKNMQTISHLDFVRIGPKASLEQFPAGGSVIEDDYLKSTFGHWLNFDSMAASNYLAGLPKDEPKLRLLVPEVAKFAESKGDEEGAKKWGSYLDNN